MNFRISNPTLASSLLLVLCNGCALKKPPDRPAILHESAPGVTVPEKWKAPAEAGAKIADNWLAGFQDPQLQALVAEGLRNSPDLGAAAARMEAAAGAVKLAGAKLYPEIAVRGALTEQSKGRLFEGIATGAAAGVLWELDLWGRVRAGRAAASETHRAESADYEFARQSLAAAVARSWFLASQGYEQREIARVGAANFEQLLLLTKVRREQGFATDEDVAVTSADHARSRDFLTSTELVFQDAVRALEILIGRYPSTELQTRPELPPVPGPVPAGVPSELLERRPDLVAAERRVAAAFYLTAEAKAARVPKISIGAAIGTASADYVGNRDVSNPIWSVGGAVVQPIFLGGALNARVKIRTAEQRAAVGNYGSVALRALNEVEGALAAEAAYRDRELAVADQVRFGEESVRLVGIRYKIGRIDQLFCCNNRTNCLS